MYCISINNNSSSLVHQTTALLRSENQNQAPGGLGWLRRGSHLYKTTKVPIFSSIFGAQHGATSLRNGNRTRSVRVVAHAKKMPKSTDAPILRVIHDKPRRHFFP